MPINNPMPPPWLMYPHIPHGSIGWRMGYGETYRYKFYDWFEKLSKAEQKQYQLMFPAPKTWSGYYDDSGAERDHLFENGIGVYGVVHWSANGKPSYSKEWLINQNTDAEFVFFWKPGDIKQEPQCCLGQWQYSEFSRGGSDYTCAEQYMMAEKARLFEDKEMEKKIMEETDPKQIKAFGRKIKNFDGKIWDRLKFSVVLNGNYNKFAQNGEMRDILLATGDKILVEASPLDSIWGIGFSEKNADAANPKCWRGLNLLGFALMEVRDEIKTVYQNFHKIGNVGEFEK